MNISKRIKVNLDRKGMTPTIDVVRGDTNTRTIELELFYNDAAWTPPDGVSIAVKYKRPGGYGVYDTMSDGSAAGTVSGNVLTVKIAPQALVSAGIVQLNAAMLLSGGSEVLHTFPIVCLVAENATVENDPVDIGGGGATGRVEIDTTLTKSGFAADAAVTGQKFTEVNTAVSKVNSSISALSQSVDNVVTKVEANSKAIEQINEELENLTLYPAYIDEEAARVAGEAVGKQNADTFTFLAVADTHYNSANAQSMESIRHAGIGAELVAQRVHIDFAALLGDYTWGSDTTTTLTGRSEIMATSAALSDAYRAVPNFRVPGNHERMIESFDLNGGYLEDAALYPLVGAYNAGAVLPGADRQRGYCYRDFDGHKLRVIALNTADIADWTVTADTDACLISGTQLRWLVEALDLSGKEDAASWSILLLSHHPLDYPTNYIRYADTILAAYLAGSSGSVTQNGLTVSYDFAGKNQATVIANIHGHIHNYKVGTLEASGITRACIPNASFSRNNDFAGDTAIGTMYGEDTTYNKEAGTARDTAFCVVTVDTAQKTLHLTRYGAGYDRTVDYSTGTEEPPTVTYTVTNHLTNVTSSNAAVNVAENSSYSARLTAASGYELDTVTVTMGGVDVTGSVYSNGAISIPAVTGNVVITATAVLVQEETKYSVTLELAMVQSSNQETSVTEGEPYSTTITAETGYALDSVTVTMGGGDVTEDVYADGVVDIPAVTGDIVITATAVLVQEETKYSVTLNLSMVTSSNLESSVTENAPYSTTLTAASGYELKVVTVTMGGVDVTGSVYSNGAISIPAVTGNVVITAVASSGDYINQIPFSTDLDGSIYNGRGWKENTYLSSGNVGTKVGYSTTGFIPIPEVTDASLGACVLYFANMPMDVTDTYNRLSLYDENRAHLATKDITNTVDVEPTDTAAIYRVMDGDNLAALDLSIYNNYLATHGIGVAKYVRLGFFGLGYDTVCTVNEPIGDSDIA